MELRQLEYFIAVCKELHFTKAAEKLNIAQPTLSQQIKSLEDEIGIPLFDRVGKKTVLTEAGSILLSHCRRVFFEIEQAKAAIRDLNELERGKLRIGSLLTCANYLLPPAIISFKQLYPSIHLSVLGLRNGDIMQGLLENEFDLGVTFLPVENEELETIPLFTEELSLAVPYDHPLASLGVMNMGELGNTPIILMPKNYYLRQLVDNYCREIGVALNPTLEMTSLESLTKVVSAGLGVTVLPEPYLDTVTNQQIVKVKLVHPTPKREIGFVYRKNRYMCSATRAFISHVGETSKTISLL